MTKQKSKGSVASVEAFEPFLKKFETLQVYIAETPEASKLLQTAFAPMLTPGTHRSIKGLLSVNQPEDGTKVQVVARETGCWWWRKYRELLFSVEDGDEHLVVALTGAFKPEDVQRLISSSISSIAGKEVQESLKL